MEKTKRAATGRDSEKYIVRFPEGMRDRIAEEAKANNRSMNAEIVARLMDSFIDPPGANVNERRKLELVNSYAKWCAETGSDPYTSFSSYAEAYVAPDKNESIDRVSFIETVDRHYLAELYSIWILERPQRFPCLSDSQTPPDPRLARANPTEPDPLFMAEVERRAAEWGCSKTRALIRMTIEEVEQKKHNEPAAVVDRNPVHAQPLTPGRVAEYEELLQRVTYLLEAQPQEWLAGMKQAIEARIEEFRKQR